MRRRGAFPRVCPSTCQVPGPAGEVSWAYLPPALRRRPGALLRSGCARAGSRPRGTSAGQASDHRHRTRAGVCAQAGAEQASGAKDLLVALSGCPLQPARAPALLQRLAPGSRRWPTQLTGLSPAPQPAPRRQCACLTELGHRRPAAGAACASPADRLRAAGRASAADLPGPAACGCRHWQTAAALAPFVPSLSCRQLTPLLRGWATRWPWT